MTPGDSPSRKVYEFPPIAGGNSTQQSTIRTGAAMKTLKQVKSMAKAIKYQPTPAEYEFDYRLRRTSLKYHWNKRLGLYIVDFVFPHKLLIIEIDGERHNDPKVMAQDKRRDGWFRAAGFVVWRMKNENVGNFDIETIEGLIDRTASAVGKAMAKVGAWAKAARGKSRRLSSNT